MTIKFIVVLAYVIVMLWIGFACMKKNKTISDFFLAGRSLGPWMSAFAYGTTYFSAVLFVGYAGRLGWGFGIHSLWIALGNVLFGSLLAWWIFAGRTRAMTVRLNALTMPEFLGARFGSPFLKFASAILIFVFLVPYSASVYAGLSYLFQANFGGISLESALIFLAAITGVYLMAGGYRALAVTDFMRGIVELIGVIVMVWFLAHLKGGFGVSMAALHSAAAAPALNPPPSAPPAAFPGWLTLLSLVLITSFGPWGMPQMVQKFYSIKSQADIKRAMIIATLFALMISFGAYYTGALTHLFYSGNVKAMLAAKYHVPPTQALDRLMPDLLTNAAIIPSWVSMVILLLVFSASMSSLSSLVLVSSSSIAVDLYGGIKKNASKTVVMTMMRILCGVFVAVSLYIALRQIDFIVNLMALSWGALAAAFLAPYCYGLFWKRVTKAGAIVGMISGLGTMLTFVAIHWDPKGGNPSIPIASALGMIVPVIVVPIVSLLTPPPSKEIIDRAFTDVPEAAEPV